VTGDREARIAANEAVFRLVNEKIEAMNAAFAMITDTFAVVCECGNSACAEQIEVQTSTYERARSDPTLFIVVPGHETDDVEDVVERHGGYDVVRKRGRRGEAVAQATDPRT
jgi:hypothetical protein